MDTPKRRCLRRLSGRATSLGTDFEYKLAGLVALRARKEQLHFELYSNAKVATPCDDLVLRILQPFEATIFIQLKHSNSSDRTVTQEAFTGESGDFSLGKYFSFFENLSLLHTKRSSLDGEELFLTDCCLDNTFIVIFTTKKVTACTTKYCTLSKDIRWVSLLRTKDEVLCFSESDSEVWNMLENQDSLKIDTYKNKFLPQLVLFSSQDRAVHLDGLVKQEINLLFGKEMPRSEGLAEKYLKNVKSWAQFNSKGCCLTESSHELERAISDELNHQILFTVEGHKLVFQDNYCKKLHSTLEHTRALRIEVPGVSSMLRATKILQVLKRHFCDKWIYIDGNALEIYPMAALIDVCSIHSYMVVNVDEIQLLKKAKELLQKVKLRVPNIVVCIFARCDSPFVLEDVPCIWDVFIDDWQLEHLEESSQESILDRQLLFQGVSLQLRDLEDMWPHLREEVDGSFLCALVQRNAAIGVAPHGGGNDYFHIQRTLEHAYVLSKDVLGLINIASEHIAFGQISSVELEKIEQLVGSTQNSGRWSVLSEMGECSLSGDKMAFTLVCQAHLQHNVHWIEYAEGDLFLWRRSHGDPTAIQSFIQPISEGCNLNMQNSTCIHNMEAEEELDQDTAARKNPAVLLVGEPGIGKTHFLECMVVQTQKRTPARWAIFVQLRLYRKLLQEFPDNPTELKMTHAVNLLSEAAGIVPGEATAQRCLEAALFESRAIEIFVDGVDEICPKYKDKALYLLRLLLTHASRIWVASRPEVEKSLRRTLQCVPLELKPLTRSEQEKYLQKFWASSKDSALIRSSPANPFSPEDFAPLAIEMVTALANASGCGSNARSLLDVPLHLNMVATAFTDEAHKAAHAGFTNLGNQKINILHIYQHFVKLKQQRFKDEHGFSSANIENTNFEVLVKENFNLIHQEYAMLLLISADTFPNINSQPFEEAVAKHKDNLNKEKTGILWLDEEEQPNFSHFSFLEYFAASWLYENALKQRHDSLYPDILQTLYRGKTNNMVRVFLDLMLAKGKPLHEAVLAGDYMAVTKSVAEGSSLSALDEGGRLALHLAASHGCSDVVDNLLRAGCDPKLADLLLGWTPLQYADVACELEVADSLLKAGANCSQLITIAKAGPQFLWKAVRSNLIKLVEMLMKLDKSRIETALHIAVSEGKLKIVELLFSYNVQIDCKAECGRTPLHAVALSGHICIAKILISKGANLNALDEIHQTPLHLAVQEDHVEIVQLLISKGATLDKVNEQGLTVLCVAAKNGHVKVADILLQNGADINFVDFAECSPIIWAARQGHTKMVEFLISHKAFVNVANCTGKTPLHFAATKGNLEVAEILLVNGADVNKADLQHWFPLHYAANSGHLEMIQLLLNHEGNIDCKSADNCTPLLIATQVGHLNVAEMLLEKGAKINVKDVMMWSPLHYATERQFVDLVGLLLKHEADINLTTKEGDTPLHIASYNGHGHITEILLDSGSDVNKYNDAHFTALHIAGKRGLCRVVEKLLEFKADVDCTTDEGMTPLHIVCHEGHLEIVEILLKNNANVSKKDNNHYTALHNAVEKGYNQIVELLLSNGANIHFTTRDGCTPLDLTIKQGHVRTAEILLARGANVNDTDEYGRTPLHQAVTFGQVELIELFLTKNADIQCTSSDGRTPLSIATSEKHWKVLQILLEKGLKNRKYTDVKRWQQFNRSDQDEVEGEQLNSDYVDVEFVTPEGYTYLHIASWKGDISNVDRLLVNGANVNQSDEALCNPLHFAADRGNLEVAKRLVANGAMVNSRELNGKTPLHLAILNNHLHVADFLLQNGSNCNQRDKNKWTPLHFTSLVGDVPGTCLLLRHGADVRCTTGAGNTPLHLAATKGRVKVAKMLLKKGAKVNKKDKKSLTPLYLASYGNHTSVVRLLLARGANVKISTHNGESPLHIAASQGHLVVAADLLAHGAGINDVDSEWCTPLQKAAQQGQIYVVNFLLALGANVHCITKSGQTAFQPAVQVHQTHVVKALSHAESTKAKKRSRLSSGSAK